MLNFLLRMVLRALFRMRWAYFHIHPGYTKVYFSATEAHFFHARTNSLHSNYRVE